MTCRQTPLQPLPHLSAVTQYTQSSLGTFAPLQKVHTQGGHQLSCPHALLYTLSFLEEHSRETQGANHSTVSWNVSSTDIFYSLNNFATS